MTIRRNLNGMRIFIGIVAACFIFYDLALNCSAQMSERGVKWVANFESDATSVTIPIRVVAGFPIIDLMINQHGPYPFVLDSGCSVMCVSKELVDKLKLPRVFDDKEYYVYELPPDQKYDAAGIDLVSIGPLRLGKVFAVVINPNNYRSHTGEKIQGLIGIGYFRGWNVRFDFQHLKVTINRSAPKLNAGFYAYPIKIVDECPVIQLPIGTKTQSVTISTGFHSSIFAPEPTALKFPLHGEKYNFTPSVMNLYKPIPITATRLNANIRLGNTTVEQPYVLYMNGEDTRTLIGFEILSHFLTDLDLIHNVASFEGNGKTLSFPNKRRLDVTMSQHNGRMFIDTVTGRLAEMKVNVQAGDEVLTINHLPVANVTNADIRKLIAEKDSIPLRLKRAGQEFDCTGPVLVDTFSK